LKPAGTETADLQGYRLPNLRICHPLDPDRVSSLPGNSGVTASV
jgi:hypothetical protein